ncbi:MAG: pro-sigmaK processing inhibitor BofA family protein [Bacillota bacterium]|nr:pro-sigmaK processing inhibitor BofA family protein [Bacillota bacterium]
MFTIIKAFSKSKKPAKSAILSMFCGFISLLLVNLTGIFTGVTLPISLLTVLTAVIGGIPGVTLLLGLNLFF